MAAFQKLQTQQIHLVFIYNCDGAGTVPSVFVWKWPKIMFREFICTIFAFNVPLGYIKPFKYEVDGTKWTEC